MLRKILIVTISILFSFNTIGQSVVTNAPDNILSHNVDELQNSEVIPLLISEDYEKYESPRFPYQPKSEALESEARIVKYFLLESPPDKNYNYFSYRGEHTIGLDSTTTRLVDSLLNTLSTLTILDEFVQNNNEQINMVLKGFKKEYERFQEEKRLEAKAHLAWPSLVIVCIALLIPLYRKDTLRYILVLLIIAGVVGTLGSLADWIILLKGYDFSLLNEIG